MKRRIRTTLHSFAPFAFLLSCTPAQQQQAQSAANAAGLGLAKVEVICGAVETLLSAAPEDTSLVRLKELCDAGATAAEVHAASCESAGFERASR